MHMSKQLAHPQEASSTTNIKVKFSTVCKQYTSSIFEIYAAMKMKKKKREGGRMSDAFKQVLQL